MIPTPVTDRRPAAIAKRLRRRARNVWLAERECRGRADAVERPKRRKVRASL